MPVRFSDTAEADLEEIADYIAADDADVAVLFVMDIREACFALADYPRRYPLVDEVGDGTLRRRPLGNYLIFYRVDGSTVAISRIVNAARDLKRVSFPEDQAPQLSSPSSGSAPASRPSASPRSPA